MTTYAPDMLCYAGYSENWLSSMLFFISIFLVCYLIPSILVIIFYRKIMKKLQAMSDHLNQDSTVVQQTSLQITNLSYRQSRARRNQVHAIFQVSSGQIELPNLLHRFRQNKNRKIKRFAKQTIILNGLILIATFFSLFSDVNVIMSAKSQMDSISQKLQKLVPIIRTIFLCIQLAVPIISLAYSPAISISFKNLSVKIKNSSFFNSSATRINSSSMRSNIKSVV